MKKRNLKKRYPLLFSEKKLQKIANKATEALQIYGTYADQEKFKSMISPGLFLELLDYWLVNDGAKLDWRTK